MYEPEVLVKQTALFSLTSSRSTYAYIYFIKKKNIRTCV